MTSRNQPLTKEEIADGLGVTVDAIWRWTRQFQEWLSVDAHCREKGHDSADVQIYRIVRRTDSDIDASIVLPERAELVRRALWSSQRASSIRMAHQLERKQADIERWALVSSHGICLRREYAWLRPLGSSITSILVCGCWTCSGDTCSEPYALLWTLDADSVVVVDKNADYIRNARDWLHRTRRSHPYFGEYDVEFLVGDMTQGIAGLEGDTFDLAYCANVLYNMQDDQRAVQVSVEQMARVVKRRGWVVAVEPKFGAEFEETEIESRIGAFTVPRQLTRPIDMSPRFEEAGLRRVDLPDAPPYSYCYRK